MKAQEFYRKVVKVGGGRYLAIGSFTPIDWKILRVKVSNRNGDIIVVLEKVQ